MNDLTDTPAPRIDFVADVACPWGAVGLNSLEAALQKVAGRIQVDLHFQPSELNPTLAPEVFEQALRQIAERSPG